MIKQSQTEKIKKLTLTFCIVVLISLPLLVFLNTLNNSFHLDDHYRVVNNPGIQKIMPVWRHFIDPRTSTTYPPILQFRPMLPLTLSLNYVLGQNSLAGYHLVNILFHILAVLLVFFLLLELLKYSSPDEENKKKNLSIAFGVASIFAIHPISGIPINYICSRDLILMYMFFLFSFLMYIRMRTSGQSLGKWSIILVSLIFSLFSKENAAVMPLLVLLYEICIQKQDWRKKDPWLYTLPFAATVIMIHIYPKLFLNFSDFQSLPKGIDKFIGYPLSQAKVHLFTYMTNFLYPFTIRLHTDSYSHIIFNLAVLVGIVFILVTIILAWRMRKKTPLISFSVLAYWTLMIPSSSIIPLFYTRLDYRPYPSSPFLFLIVTLFIFKYMKTKQRTILYIILLSYFSISSIFINRIWRTEKIFYTHAIKHGGGSLEYLNMGMATKNLNERKKHLEHALKLNPNYTIAHINLGLALIHLGQINEGLLHFNRALQLEPNKALSYYWIAKGYKHIGRKKEALAYLQKAATLDPRHIQYSYEAALESQKTGAFNTSLRFINNITKIDPNYKNILFLKGFALQKLGKIDECIHVYKAFLEKQPKHYQATFNLAYAYMDKRNYQEAIKFFHKTLELQSHYNEVYLHLSNCYNKLGEKEKADGYKRVYGIKQKRNHG